jgi:hypothetical protein
MAKSFYQKAAEARERDLLHLRDVDAFAEFCEADGWMRVETKGHYEALRMARPDKFNGSREWLIVYRRDPTFSGDINNVRHGVVWGNSALWAKKFYRSRKEEQINDKRERD